MLEVAGEVLAAHARQRDLVEIRLADDLARGADARPGHVGIIHDGVGPAAEVTWMVAPLASREAAGDLPDPFPDPGRGGLAQRPDRPLEHDLLGDDVGARPPWMEPKVTTTGSRESTERGTN